MASSRGSDRLRGVRAPTPRVQGAGQSVERPKAFGNEADAHAGAGACRATSCEWKPPTLVAPRPESPAVSGHGATVTSHTVLM